MKKMTFKGPLQYEKTYERWEELAKEALGKASSQLSSLMLKIEHGRTTPEDLVAQLNEISLRTAMAASSITEDMLPEGDHLKTVHARDKFKIVQEFGYFSRYILEDFTRRNQAFAEFLWGVVFQDDKATAELRMHVEKLRLNGKLRGKKGN